MPGALVLRMALVTVLAILLAGAGVAWLVSRATYDEAIRKLESQQIDEVEMVARILASKIEQSQRMLDMVATGIAPEVLTSSTLPDWVWRRNPQSVRFFDALQVAGQDGELRLNLRAGRPVSAAGLDPAERDYLRRTLAEGKPLVSEVITGRAGDARVMLTLPLRREDGSVSGVLAGALPLQSQGLLPQSLAPPERGDSRLIVFARDGTILSHPDPARLLHHVRDEPGLGQAYAQWFHQGVKVVGRASTHVLPGYVVTMTGMPLPQWMVARITDSRVSLAALRGAQREAGWMAAMVVAVCAATALSLMVWLSQPLSRLCQRAAQMLRPGAAPAFTGVSASGEVGLLADVLHRQARYSATKEQDRVNLLAQLQSLLEVAPVGIVLTRDGVLQVLGRKACEMLAYADGELQGHPARTLFASDADFADVHDRVRAELASHGVFDGDVCFMRKDGSPLWARVRGRKVAGGNVGDSAVWILEDITAEREEQHLPAWEAEHDPLTQLPNRRAFDQRLHLLLKERVGRARGTGVQEAPETPALSAGVLLFIDLDHFTVVNAVAGHEAGDDVLRHVARLLEMQVRSMGWAARLGGDEFAVVLPGCPLARGQAVAEQLLGAIQAWEPSYGGRSFTLSASIGLVVLNDELCDVARVLHEADMACYGAKRNGRNRVQVHTHESAPRSDNRQGRQCAAGP